jgi:hypothetical protein
MDALTRKACELGEKTAHFRVEVVLKATLWMEEKYRQVPNPKIARDDRPALPDTGDAPRITNATSHS